jgi:hypothetical protein
MPPGFVKASDKRGGDESPPDNGETYLRCPHSSTYAASQVPFNPHGDDYCEI